MSQYWANNDDDPGRAKYGKVGPVEAQTPQQRLNAMRQSLADLEGRLATAAATHAPVTLDKGWSTERQVNHPEVGYLRKRVADQKQAIQDFLAAHKGQVV